MASTTRPERSQLRNPLHSASGGEWGKSLFSSCSRAQLDYSLSSPSLCYRSLGRKSLSVLLVIRTPFTCRQSKADSRCRDPPPLLPPAPPPPPSQQRSPFPGALPLESVEPLWQTILGFDTARTDHLLRIVNSKEEAKVVERNIERNPSPKSGLVPCPYMVNLSQHPIFLG